MAHFNPHLSRIIQPNMSKSAGPDAAPADPVLAEVEAAIAAIGVPKPTADDIADGIELLINVALLGGAGPGGHQVQSPDSAVGKAIAELKRIIGSNNAPTLKAEVEAQLKTLARWKRTEDGGLFSGRAFCVPDELKALIPPPSTFRNHPPAAHRQPAATASPAIASRNAALIPVEASGPEALAISPPGFKPLDSKAMRPRASLLAEPPSRAPQHPPSAGAEDAGAAPGTESVVRDGKHAQAHPRSRDDAAKNPHPAGDASRPGTPPLAASPDSGFVYEPVAAAAGSDHLQGSVIQSEQAEARPAGSARADLPADGVGRRRALKAEVVCHLSERTQQVVEGELQARQQELDHATRSNFSRWLDRPAFTGSRHHADQPPDQHTIRTLQARIADLQEEVGLVKQVAETYKKLVTAEEDLARLQGKQQGQRDLYDLSHDKRKASKSLGPATLQLTEQEDRVGRIQAELEAGSSALDALRQRVSPLRPATGIEVVPTAQDFARQPPHLGED